MSVRPTQVEYPGDLPPVRVQQLGDGVTAVLVNVVERQLFLVLACAADYVPSRRRPLPRLLLLTADDCLSDADGTQPADQAGLLDQLLRSELDFVAVFI